MGIRVSRWRVFAAGLSAFAFICSFAPPFGSGAAHAADKSSWNQKIPEGFQSYLERPTIRKTQARSHPELEAKWTKLVHGHIETVALLLEMYPDQEIYFLARDSELLYDLAQWEARNDAELGKRIHLLNISRSNMQADHVRDYLAQEGISRASLSAGKKILFVDTGFEGSIPNQIATYFPAKYKESLQTHLLVSGNGRFPSTRVFLTALDPKAPGRDPETLHDALVEYEHLPRFTERSDGFVKVEGQWHPVSPKSDSASSSDDGKVSESLAVKYQEDLLSQAQKAESRQLMRVRRAQWRKLRALSEAGKAEPIEAELRALLEKTPDDPFAEAMVRDFIEMNQTTLKGGKRLPPSAARFGLKVIPAERGFLEARFPEYKDVMSHPEEGVGRIVREKDWAGLSMILDELRLGDAEPILAELHALPTEEARKIISRLIARASTDQERLIIARSFFPYNKRARSFEEELLLLTDKMKPESMWILAGDVFSAPEAVAYKKALRRMMEKADEYALSNIRRSLQFDEHWRGKKFDVYREAALIRNRAQRVRFLRKLDQGGQASAAKAAAAGAESETEIGPELEKGDRVTTGEGRLLTVLERVDEGKRGVVFRVKDANGKRYALKVAKDSDPETLESLGKEAKKASLYDKYDLAHSKVIESRETYALKEWVEGTRADEWISSWSKSAKPSGSAPQLLGLGKLIQGAADAGVYVGDLNPKNLIWDGKRWVIIDSGSVRDGKTPEQALARYLEKIPERWSQAASVSKRACVMKKLTGALSPPK